MLVSTQSLEPNLKTMFSIRALTEFLNEPTWRIVRFRTSLEDWTGLIPFDQVYDLIHEDEAEFITHNNELEGHPDYSTMGDIEARIKIGTVLQQLTDRFLSSCGNADGSNELSYSPALIILPVPEQAFTAIGGIIFNLEISELTHMCFPRRYGRFWQTWFKLHDQQFEGFGHSYRRKNTLPPPDIIV